MRVFFFLLALILGAFAVYLLSIGILRGGATMLPTFVLGTGLFISATILLTASGIDISEYLEDTYNISV